MAKVSLTRYLNRLSYRSRLLLAFAGTLALTFILMGLLFYLTITRSLRQERARQLSQLANHVLSQLDVDYSRGFLAEPDPALAREKLSAQWDQTVAHATAELVERQFSVAFALIDRDGEELRSSKIEPNLAAQMQAVFEALQVSRGNGLKTWRQEEWQKLKERMEHGALIRTGEIEYAPSGIWPFYEALQDHIRPYEQIAHERWRMASELGRPEWISILRPIWLRKSASDNGRIAFFFFLCAHYDVNQMSAQALLKSLGWAASVAFVAALLVLFVFTHIFSQPISNLIRAARAIGAGDYSVRVPLIRRWSSYAAEEGEEASSDFSEDEFLRSADPGDELAVLSENFNRMAAALGDQEQARRDFIAAISHDLRTPLTSIVGFVGGMQDGIIEPAAYPRYLQIIKDETERLRQMVMDIDDSLNISETKYRAQQDRFELQSWIAQTLNALEGQLVQKGITVTCPDNHLPIWVQGDERALQRVLYNLCINAIRFIPDHGLLDISWEQPNGMSSVSVSVADNGPGVSNADRAHIFQRFYKGDRTRGKHTGSGLGLYICQQILHAHGQSIEVGDSELGGAKFTFTLPVV